mgnify:CR=1 FL=1
MQRLNEFYNEELIKFGTNKFKRLMKQNSDRKMLIKLILGELTLDQFITRAFCQS